MKRTLLDQHIIIYKNEDKFSKQAHQDALKFIVDTYSESGPETRKHIRESLPELYSDIDDHRQFNPTESEIILEGQLRYGHITQRTKALTEKK